MKRLTVNFDSKRMLSMRGPKRVERLAIRGNYPWNPFSELLFTSLGTMHLVAPYLPDSIKTSFLVPYPAQALIRRMYEYEKVHRLFFLGDKRCFKNQKKYQHGLTPAFVMPNLEKPVCNANTSKNKVAVAYSAGKDSMWNLWRAIEQYGVDNVLVIHIRNLNKNSGFIEYQNVLKQQKQFGFKHLEIIDLHNGSLNTNYQTMRSRDMFLAGIMIPPALEFGASQIITEGFHDATPDEPFTGIEENMVFFNGTLEELGIPVRVTWKNRPEMLVIKDLFEHKPEWMPHLCNCFCLLPFIQAHRRMWQKRLSSFPLYDSQCGHCVKCRIVNVARVLHDPAMAKVKQEDIRNFLKGTDVWIQDEGNKTHADMIGGSFMKDFATACRRYRIKPKSV